MKRELVLMLNIIEIFPIFQGCQYLLQQVYFPAYTAYTV